MKTSSLFGYVSKVKTIFELIEDLFRSEEHKDLCPDIFLYNSLFTSYANSRDNGSKESAEKAEELFANMKKMPDYRPTIYTYNTVISCYAKCGDVAKVESMVCALEKNAFERRKKYPYPNSVTYNTLLDALAKSDEKDAPEKAEATLRKMQSFMKEEMIQVWLDPMFGLSIQCWNAMHAMATPYAENIVNHMENFRAHKEFEQF